jgi:putative ABC transport system substrate-binding protein
MIGFLSVRSPDESKNLVARFRSGLAESGFVEGQNVAIEYRWARGEYDRLPALAAELVRIPVRVLVAVGGDSSALAARASTTTVPIVASFTSDPVKTGMIASFNRPGGNITGISNLTAAMEPKRIGLLRELVPQATTFGVLLNPDNPPFADQLRDVREAVKSAGLALQVLRASSDREIEAAFESVAQAQIPALLVAADPFFNLRRDKLATLAVRHGVPAMYSFRDYAVAGGLMSYGINLPDVYYQTGVYAARILKGAKPADLPVQQPTKFEFVINLKTAKTLGIKLSDNLMSLADEVIE